MAWDGGQTETLSLPALLGFFQESAFGFGYELLRVVGGYSQGGVGVVRLVSDVPLLLTPEPMRVLLKRAHPDNRSRWRNSSSPLERGEAHDLPGRSVAQTGLGTCPQHQQVGLSVTISSHLNWEGPG